MPQSDSTTKRAPSATPKSTNPRHQNSFAGFKAPTANFTPAPNQFFDKVVGHYHPCVVSVIAILIRSTLGWADPDTGERRHEAELSLSDFVRPELSRGSARSGLAQAIEAGFIIETMPATNKQAARYALKWEDSDQQQRAILKQRKTQGRQKRRGCELPSKPKRISRGATIVPQAAENRGTTVRPQSVRPPTVVPPIDKDVLKKSSLKKEIYESEKKASPPEKAEFSEDQKIDLSQSKSQSKPKPLEAAQTTQSREQACEEKRALLYAQAALLLAQEQGTDAKTPPNALEVTHTCSGAKKKRRVKDAEEQSRYEPGQ